MSITDLMPDTDDGGGNGHEDYGKIHVEKNPETTLHRLGILFSCCRKFSLAFLCPKSME
jgi:hypothetical protein